jgi:hypothetical protein
MALSFVLGVLIHLPRPDSTNQEAHETRSQPVENGGQYRDLQHNLGGNGTPPDPLKITDWLLAGFTGILVLVAVLQYRVLGRQAVAMLKQTRYSRHGLNATRESARAATKSANVASDALIKLERAFIVFKLFKWVAYADPERHGRWRYRITPVLENTGRTQT